MKNRRVFSRILCVLLALSIVLQQADLSGFTGIFGGGTVVAEADTTYNVTINVGYTDTLSASLSSGQSASSHTWTVTDSSIATISSTSSASVTVTGVAEGTVTITHTYTVSSGGGGRPGGGGSSGTTTVTDTYAITVVDEDVLIYVYVAGYDLQGNAYSDDMLEALGIDRATLDNNDYFPVGIITLKQSYFSGKDTSAAITSEGDWDIILEALENLDTYAINQTGYTANQGNNVANYIDQIEHDISYAAGTKRSALFSWSVSSYGFQNSNGGYHLDLRFSCVTITYCYGNNNITGITNGSTIGSKVFIKGATMDYTPTIDVSGYMVVGYYKDADFTEEWDAVGQEITEDTTVYVKLAKDPISVTVEKEWDDYGNIYGTQPSSVSVTLYNINDTVGTQTLNETGSWSYTYEKQSTQHNGAASVYTITENAVEGYTVEYSYAWNTSGTEYICTATNTLDVGYLTISKEVVDPDGEAGPSTFTFEVSGFDDDATGVLDSSGSRIADVSSNTATITVEEDSSVTLMVPVGTYTVTETTTSTTDSNGTHERTTSYNSSQSAIVTSENTTTVEVTNTITGNAEVTITKNWDDSNNAYSTRPTNDGSNYTVTLTANNATDSGSYSYTTSSSAWTETDTNTWTTTLTVPMYDSNGKKLTYAVTEMGTNLSTYYTLSDGSTGSVTPSDSTTVSLTNTLNTGTVTVEKVVQNSDGSTASDNSDTFSFTLSTADGVTIGSEQSVAAGSTITFSSVPLNVQLSLIESVTDSQASHSYTTTATVGGTDTTVSDGGYDSASGTKTSTISFTATDSGTTAVVVTNQEQSVSVDLSSILKGTKTLTGADTTKTFSYTVTDTTSGSSTYNQSIATGSATVSSGNTVDITWEYTSGSTITLDKVGTYTYVIKEDNGNTGGVSYDTAYYTLTITVSKDTSTGELVATASMTKTTGGTMTDVSSDNNSGSFIVGTVSGNGTTADTFTAAFTNEYTVTSTTLNLSGTKTLSGRAIADGEFSVQIQQVSDASASSTIGSTITTSVSAGALSSGTATGSFSQSITYTSAGIYYYKVSEVDTGKGSEGVTYDTNYYIITVEVEDTGGALNVASTSVAYYDSVGNSVASSATYSTLTFSNTYSATGTAALSAYKVLAGRNFNSSDTFTFYIEAVGNSAPFPDTITGTNASDNRYIEVTVSGSDLMANAGTLSSSLSTSLSGSSTGQYCLINLLSDLSLDIDDVGTWTYKVTEATGTANGMTYNNGSYSTEITLTLTDNGNGTLSATTSSSNAVDLDGNGTDEENTAIIVNTFSQGSTTIYGAKVWVDGGKSHMNSSEVTLTLYYSVNNGTDWTEYPSGSYSVVWSDNNWQISDLPVYDTSGNAILYKVVETAVSGYTTTYDSTDGDDTDAEAVPSTNADDSRYTITNTIVQEYVTLSGTKTWVDADSSVTHSNASEITFTVTRNSTGTGQTTLEVNSTDPSTAVDDTYIVVWIDGSYTIYWYGDATNGYTGLPKYDAYGYEYTYTVTENAVKGEDADGEEFTYETTTTADTNGSTVTNFTNRQPSVDPVTPTKAVTAITSSGGTPKTASADTKVAVGDTVEYTITYYNNTNNYATVVVTDTLDVGVDFVSASAALPDGNTTTLTGTVGTNSYISYDSGTREVTWTIDNVPAFSYGTVTLTVTVNSSARTVDANETSADIDNTASVKIGSATAVNTNTVTNLLEDDEPKEPTKAVELTSGSTDYNDANAVVKVDDTLYYRISYYNHYNDTATITITDTLDEGLTFVSATDGGTNNSGTVTWTLTDVSAFTGGYVYLQVTVNSSANVTASASDTASVTNTATVNVKNSNGDDVSGSTNTVTNSLELGNLTLAKTVKADSLIDLSGISYTFIVKANNGELDGLTTVFGSDGNSTYTVSDGSISVPLSAGQSVTLVNLPVGSYTVTESGVTADGTVSTTDNVNNKTYTWTVTGSGEAYSVSADNPASATITNTLTGTITATATKNWVDNNNSYSLRDSNIYITLTAVDADNGTVTKTPHVDSNGKTYIYNITMTGGTTESTWTYSLDNLPVYDADGNRLTYQVTETSINGYTTTYSNSALFTPADSDSFTITNTLQTGNVSVTKEVLDADGNTVNSSANSDKFVFVLYDSNGNAIKTSGKLQANGYVTFEGVPVGTYTLTEQLPASNSYSYSTTATIGSSSARVTEGFDSNAGVKIQTVEVTVTDGGTTTVTVTNKEEKLEVDLAGLLKGTKLFTTSNSNTATQSFEFTVTDSDGVTVATGTAGSMTAATSAQTTAIVWDYGSSSTLTFTKIGTYTYTIKETIPTATNGVTYDTAEYTLTIEVTRDADTGELVATASMKKGSSDVASDTDGATSLEVAGTADSFSASTDSFTASFENQYDPASTSITLSGTKTLSGRTINDGEFSIVIDKLDSANATSGTNVATLTVPSGSTSGAFSEEIKFTTTGTYYYKVYEASGKAGGVSYDTHYYIITVVVTDISGTLTTTTSVVYYNEYGQVSASAAINELNFSNTYTATDTVTFSAYKVLTGREFNDDDVFTFRLYTSDSSAPFADSSGTYNGVSYTVGTDGDTRYVDIEVTGKYLKNHASEYGSLTGNAGYYALFNLFSFDVDQGDAGEWTYGITEVPGTLNGMNYDTGSGSYSKKITLEVTDNGDGTLTTNVTSENSAVDLNGDGSNETNTAIIVNTFSQGEMTIYGTKVWVDGGKSHTNSTQVELTLYYSVDGGTSWYPYTNLTTYNVTWDSLNTNNWEISDLPVYDASGNAMLYKVVETAVSGYTTAYSNDSQVYDTSTYSDSSRFTITNTIEQEYVTLSGTKTWVDADPSISHNNASEIMFTVTRKLMLHLP